MSAGCAEMRKSRKIGGFINFGETGDEPNSFYFQHNKESSPFSNSRKKRFFPLDIYYHRQYYRGQY